MTEHVLKQTPALTRQRVQNDRLELTFLPGVGGRLLSLRVDGVELLWVNPQVIDSNLRVVRERDTWPVVDGTFASWTNIGGSKSWPAPQGWNGAGEWAGPPDTVLDAGRWSFDSAYDSESSCTEVTMVSGIDPATGLQITRRFSIPDSGATFSQRIEFHNHSMQAIRWAIWEVCQVDTETAQRALLADASIEVDLVAPGTPIDLGQYFGDVDPVVAPDRVSIPITDAVSKFGFDTASGVVRFKRPDGYILEMATEVDPAAEYPDGGSRAEIWVQAPTPEPIAGLSGLHPDAWLAELELLSPLHEIVPGESVDMSIRWSVDHI